MSRRVKEYFNQVSSQWDNMRKSFYGEEVRDAVLNAAQISPDDTVLDVGAGTGFLTQGAAMIARKVIALDFSRGMSDEAIAKLGKGKVEFRIGNVERMQLPDSSVNVVIETWYCTTARTQRRRSQRCPECSNPFVVSPSPTSESILTSGFGR